MSQELTTPAVSALDFSTPEQAFAFFARHDAPIDDDITDGVASLTLVQKGTLIAVPFLAVNWRFNDNETGTFVSVEFMSQAGDRGVFNDGGTGVMAQLAAITAERESAGHKFPTSGRLVRKGLRVSRYSFTNEKGKEQQAETYYLAF